MNQDGSIQLQAGEIEIGQGADTAFSQMAVRGCAEAFKKHILETAYRYENRSYLMDIADGNIIRTTDGIVLMSLGDLAVNVLYDLEHNGRLTMEKSTQIKTNAYTFGCCFAEVEVDLEMCSVKLLDIINVHDA